MKIEVSVIQAVVVRIGLPFGLEGVDYEQLRPRTITIVWSCVVSIPVHHFLVPMTRPVDVCDEDPNG